jgi:hypothetical protein
MENSGYFGDPSLFGNELNRQHSLKQQEGNNLGWE